MDEPSFPNWCEKIDDIVIQCDDALQPHPDNIQIIIRQFCQALGKAPAAVAQYLQDPGRRIYEPLLSQDACEKVLLLTCERTGIMMSRSPAGISMSTVTIRDLDIECSFSSKSSLALALTGALCLAALCIADKSRPLQARP